MTDVEMPAHGRAVLYPPRWRVVGALLRAVSGTSLLALLVAFMRPEGPPLGTLALMRLVTGLCLLPALAALLIRRASTGRMSVRAGMLVLEHRHRRDEIPVDTIAAVEPWLVPLPASGLWLRLRSGELWRDGIVVDEPSALVAALLTAGGTPDLLPASRHPLLTFADARGGRRRRWWEHPLAKFPLFALVPTLPLFRVHQIIAYGGAFGEYQQYGLGAYLAGFALYWGTLTIYLMMYAAALRVPVEGLALGAAALLPRHAPAVRRGAERAAALLYYLGVPVAVVLRFVPW